MSAWKTDDPSIPLDELTAWNLERFIAVTYRLVHLVLVTEILEFLPLTGYQHEPLPTETPSHHPYASAGGVLSDGRALLV